MMLSLCEAPAVPSLRLDVYVSEGQKHQMEQTLRPDWQPSNPVFDDLAGSRHSGATGVGDGGV